MRHDRVRIIWKCDSLGLVFSENATQKAYGRPVLSSNHLTHGERIPSFRVPTRSRRNRSSATRWPVYQADALPNSAVPFMRSQLGLRMAIGPKVSSDDEHFWLSILLGGARSCKIEPVAPTNILSESMHHAMVSLYSFHLVHAGPRFRTEEANPDQKQKGEPNKPDISKLDPAMDVNKNASGEIDWYDVTDWGVEGRILPSEERKSWFDRFPASAEGMVTGSVWSLSRDSAGMVARFKTNAKSIHVHYKTTKDKLAMPHMPATGSAAWICTLAMTKGIGNGCR